LAVDVRACGAGDLGRPNKRDTSPCAVLGLLRRGGEGKG
jgi:hypothetical protein